MLIQEEIKPGLSYAYEAQFTQLDSFASLTKKDHQLQIQFQFSEPECKPDAADDMKSTRVLFNFDDSYLSDYADFDFNKIEEQHKVALCCNTQMILHEIEHHQFKGLFRKMFLESKALALLLCFHANQTAELNNCSSCKFLSRPTEKDKIMKAKEIILSNLEQAPTITELSLMAGINQCYLKKGFKELFGQTVYEFIQAQRMQKAKLLLTTTDLSVGQVAESVGFSSGSNFSTAFKKFSGIFPSELPQN